MQILKHGKHHRHHDKAVELPHDYDVQADLALPTVDDELAPADVVTPFAGSVVPVEQGPGYDVDRDVGL